MDEKMQHLERPGMVFGRRVREERERQHLSLRDLAARVDDLGITLDRSTLARIERGQTRGNLDTLFALAIALGVTPIHLMLPREDEAAVLVAPKRALSSADARRWVRGAPLDDSNRAAWFAAMSEEDQAAVVFQGIPPIVVAAVPDERKRRLVQSERDRADDELATRRARKSNRRTRKEDNDG